MAFAVSTAHVEAMRLAKVAEMEPVDRMRAGRCPGCLAPLERTYLSEHCAYRFKCVGWGDQSHPCLNTAVLVDIEMRLSDEAATAERVWKRWNGEEPNPDLESRARGGPY